MKESCNRKEHLYKSGPIRETLLNFAKIWIKALQIAEQILLFFQEVYYNINT